MNNEKFEKKLEDICKEDIYIPQKFTNTIRNGLYKNNIKWRFIEMKKVAVSILCTVLIGTGVVFASSMLGSFWSNNDGVKTALEYGYVQNLDMKYNEQNNLGIKLDSIIMDNSNLGIVFNYKVPTNLKNIDDIVLYDLLIKDENNNIIYQDGNINRLDTGHSKELVRENNIIKQAMLLENLNYTFPKSKKIYVSFSTVNMFVNQKKIDTIKGNWSFEVDVTDKFISRETIKYTASQSKDAEVINAEITPTGLDIEIKFNAPQNAEELIHNIKMQDNTGKKYYHIGGMTAENETTKPIIKTSFPITIFNAPDNLKLIINTDKEIIIDLTKAN